MTRKLGTLLLVVGISCGAALAGPAYVGVAIGQSNVEVSDSGSNFDASDTGYKVYGGFRIWKFFGVEGSYVDFGSPDDSVSGSDVTIDATAWDAFAVGVLPFGKHFEIFGKLGLVFWDSDVDVSGSGTDSDSGNDMAYGLGVAFIFGEHFGVRGEYEVFDIEDTENVDQISVGAEFRF